MYYNLVLFPSLNEDFILTHHFIFTQLAVIFYNKSYSCNIVINKFIHSNTFDNQLLKCHCKYLCQRIKDNYFSSYTHQHCCALKPFWKPHWTSNIRDTKYCFMWYYIWIICRKTLDGMKCELFGFPSGVVQRFLYLL